MQPDNLQRVFVVLFFVLIFHGCAQTPHTHHVSPAYRPHSDIAAEFVEALESAAVAVYPTIIRYQEETVYSTDSQKQILQLLTEERVTTPVIRTEPLAPGPPTSPPQWEMFVHDLDFVADSLKKIKPGTPYNLVLEVIFSPGNQSVFGIHYYIFDHQGNNAFSFLLNSHHQLFRNAQLNAMDSSSESRASLIERATRVGVKALVEQVKQSGQMNEDESSGYSITSQTVAPFAQKVDKIFVLVRIPDRLKHVFMHSLKHSLESGFESNGIASIIKLMPRNSADYSPFQRELESFSPVAVMYADIDPLYRERKDGYQAIVGTEFKLKVINRSTGEMAWEAVGKVDYIKMFGARYTAHEGIRKEFAWHTTAAIVKTFVLDVNGQESAPIYTVTEDRMLYHQRTD